MRYSITFTEIDYWSLTDNLRQPGSTEQATYLLCSLSITASESRLLVREVVPVLPEEIISASGRHMEIAPQSFMRAMKRADAGRLSFVFVHSHPDGPAGHSPQGSITEPSLFSTAYIRINGKAIHASIVVSAINQPRARVWHRDGTTSPVAVIRIIGDRFRFFHHDLQRKACAEIFDRQVRAFGMEIQHILKTLHLGIVGNGGTVSAVAEQLIRLGVGKLSLFEGQTLDSSNVTRVYGSRLTDVDVPKVQIIQRLAQDVGFGTEVVPVPENIHQP